MERFICVHGHFYQPPRENPWLEAIEIQDSAYPYHDWNEKITAECYAPNAASRILDKEDCITHIVSNYEKISFNFGPTLLSWMETYSPEVYEAILGADRKSIEQRSGHGNAIAQCYNHTIMPLSNTGDKRTQIIWGIKDFEHRFQRYPEGMWLPETAVDIETLDILAEFGIKFTILAPHQALKVSRIGTGEWKDVAGGQIDPTRAYLFRTPLNRKISIFFFDGQISRASAFEEELLNRGENFVARLSTGFSDQRGWPQILSIATDGETFGHHHKFADMALAYALSHIESNGLAKITNYGEYLEKFPPEHEVEIGENTSWSCVHGVDRWRKNCGCNSGKNAGWNQEWRGPLRDSLDWLRDGLAPKYELTARKYLKDPGQARDDYIEVILNRSEEKTDEFLKNHCVRDLTADEKVIVLKLMEIQRHSMLMYTSCGWFFDELSGIESVQVLQYAGRTIQLCKDILGDNFENTFLERLSKAKSNLPEHGNGRLIYEKFVRPSMIDLKKVAAHYALRSAVIEAPEDGRIYCYRTAKEDSQKLQADKTKLSVGKIKISSDITRESDTISYCILYLGGHAFNGGAQTFPGDDAYRSMKTAAIAAFENGDLAEVLRLMDAHFGTHSYSLTDLFRDEQRRIVNLIIMGTMEDSENAYRLIYEANNVLMGFLRETGIPVPKIFLITAEFVLNSAVGKAFAEEKIEEEKIHSIIKDIKRWNVSVDSVGLEFRIRRRLEEMMDDLLKNPSNTALLEEIHKMIALTKLLPFSMNFWKVQNVYYALSKTAYREFFPKAQGGDEDASLWLKNFREIGQILQFNIGTVLIEG